MTTFEVRARFLGPSVPDPEMDARLLARLGPRLAEPFVGIHAPGESRHSLFPVRKTGISTDEILERAKRFLDALTPEARSAAILDLDSDEWRKWCNFHTPLFRHGAPLEPMTAAERDRALDVLASVLTEEGFHTARDVMRLNETLEEVTGRPEEFGEWLYWLAIFGEPTANGPWGFQFDGHHLNLSCVVVGDQLVVSPFFLGSEPVAPESGRHVGIRVLQGEEADGYALMAAMTPTEQQAAIVGTDLPGELLTAAFLDNVELGYDGVAYPKLSAVAKERLVALIGRYVNRIRPGHAEVKMAEVEEHLDETYFCWIGGTGPDDVFYYRIQSPVILIEFDHLPGIVFANDHATREHIHTVIRTPNGNDYGKSLLAEHYKTHHGG